MYFINCWNVVVKTLESLLYIFPNLSWPPNFKDVESVIFTISADDAFGTLLLWTSKSFIYNSAPEKVKSTVKTFVGLEASENWKYETPPRRAIPK